MRKAIPIVASLAMLLLLVPGIAVPHPSPRLVTEACSSSLVVTDMMLITEFYPFAANDDEYLTLRNCGYLPVSMENWTISDGEGVVLLAHPHMLDPGETICISSNGSSYSDAFGVEPDIALNGWISDVNVTISGSFRLADSGDSLVLRNPLGMTVDSVCYGESSVPDGWLGPPMPSLRQGEVARRVVCDSMPIDTDLPDDWMPFREFRYGYTDHHAVFDDIAPGGVVAFSSPDCSLDVILDVIDSAKESIRVCSYELYSASFCEALARSHDRGVEVRVLVDLDPAGGICNGEVDCLSFLSSYGCTVLGIHGNLEDDVVRHIGPLHPKYIVVDDRAIVVLSENFVPDGIPVDPVHGNRGWGISVESEKLAGFLRDVFEDDARLSRGDVFHWSDHVLYVDGAVPDHEDDTHFVGSNQPCLSTQPCRIRLEISPDASPVFPFLAPLIEASEDIVFEQFQCDMAWDTRWSSESATNPLLSALIDSSMNGGCAMGLFDSSWFNIDRNEESASYLSSMYHSEGLEGSFMLMDQRSPITVLHNKGMVMDDTVLISSNNWVYSSFAKNRELAAIVESEELASYFSNLFEMDWIADETPPTAMAGPDVDADEGQSVLLDSGASTDDRAIVLIWWDLDGDDLADSYGPQVEYITVAGDHVLTVHVEDAWGNHDSDTMTVHVSGQCEVPQDATESTSGDAPFWIVPLTLIPFVWFSGRLCGRKINLGKGGS